MSKLTVISNEELKPSNGLVLDRLEESLKMAKEGGIQSCAIVMIADNGEVIDSWANGGQVFVMVGALESLKLDFMLTQMDRRN